MSARAPQAGGPVRLLLVGYGQRGTQWHAACGSRRDVLVDAVVEPDGAARDRAASGGLAVFDSAAEAAAAHPLTAAIVAAPFDRHPAAALACLEAGLAVLVEKPLALSVAQARTVVEEAAARGLPALVVQNFRYQRRERAIARSLEAQAIGRPLAGEVDSTRAVGSPVVLWDFVVHHLDAFRMRYGGPPETVTATAGGSALAIELTWADGVQVRYRHDDAAAGYRYRERIAGANGALVVDDQRVRLQRDGRRTRTVRPRGRVDPDQAVLGELLRAMAAGLNGPPSPLAAGDNVLTVATVEAVAESLRLGRTVRPSRG
jgi:predicted dehydrogenase